ncbi:hypothetical protein L208DRAFT_865528 [Tricholoma matsutake]|nr:hypothetical protein L208DRAFT_865528 [Tricholoma matsutake 945]
MTLLELLADMLGIIDYLAYPRDVRVISDSMVHHPRVSELKASLLTKPHIVRVSKQWNYFATPYLYESPIIKKIRTITKLCTACVEQPLLPMLTESRTKRFDIAIQDLGTGSDLYHEFEYLVDIIRCQHHHFQLHHDTE